MVLVEIAEMYHQGITATSALEMLYATERLAILPSCDNMVWQKQPCYKKKQGLSKRFDN